MHKLANHTYYILDIWLHDDRMDKLPTNLWFERGSVNGPPLLESTHVVQPKKGEPNWSGNQINTLTLNQQQLNQTQGDK